MRKEGSYVGSDALEEMRNAGPRRKLVTLEIDTDSAPAHSGDSVVVNDDVVGTITSAAWGYRVKKNLAMAFVDPQYAGMGRVFFVQMLGEMFPARVCADCLYDLDNENVRS